MSRIGKQPITIPDKVKVAIEGRHVKVEGPKGSLEMDVVEPIAVKQENGSIIVERPSDERKIRAFHGMVRALLNNMVVGVSQGFTRELEISGVGYRAEVSGNTVTLELGYSHPIKYELPEGISAQVERNVLLRLEGYDKELLGRTAAKIRSMRPPEPYKGKGIKYAEEYVQRKVGKKNV